MIGTLLFDLLSASYSPFISERPFQCPEIRFFTDPEFEHDLIRRHTGVIAVRVEGAPALWSAFLNTPHLLDSYWSFLSSLDLLMHTEGGGSGDGEGGCHVGGADVQSNLSIIKNGLAQSARPLRCRHESRNRLAISQAPYRIFVSICFNVFHTGKRAIRDLNRILLHLCVSRNR